MTRSAGARNGRTGLYRHYSADGELLYVGIAYDPDLRLEQHYWRRESARHTVNWFDRRRDALEAESKAIADERPRYNLQHNWEPVPFPCPAWPRLTDMRSGKSQALAALLRGEIASGRWRPGQKLPRQAALAESVGLNVDCGIRATKILWNEGLLTRPNGPMGFFVAA
ncbi:GntR family transcriptional regulator [Streptomyces xanthophaeus]